MVLLFHSSRNMTKVTDVEKVWGKRNDIVGATKKAPDLSKGLAVLLISGSLAVGDSLNL
jgi:hypothetical protein